MKVTTSIGKQGSGGTWEQGMLGIDFTKTAKNLRSTPSICPCYLDHLTLLVYISYFRPFFARFAVVRNDTN